MWFLSSVGLALSVCGIVVQLAVPRCRQFVYLLSAAAQGVFPLGDLLAREPFGALGAACCAWYLWLWWHNGGGGTTKRSLRKARDAFRPVRRSAPVAARAVTG
jgi:hypothetical protein